MVKSERMSPPESPEPDRVRDVSSNVSKSKQKSNRWNQMKTLLKNAVEEIGHNPAVGATNEGGDQMVAESSESFANQLVVKAEKEDVVVKMEPDEAAETTIQLGELSALVAGKMAELIQETLELSQDGQLNESSSAGDQAVSQELPEPTFAQSIKSESSEPGPPAEVAQEPPPSASTDQVSVEAEATSSTETTSRTNELVSSCSKQELPSKRADDLAESQLEPADPDHHSSSLNDTVSTLPMSKLVDFPAASRTASPRTCRSPRTPQATTGLRTGQYLPDKTINKIYCGSRSIANFAQHIMRLIFDDSELLECTNVYGLVNLRPIGRALDEKKVAYIRQLVRHKGGIHSWQNCVTAMNGYIWRFKKQNGKMDETNFGEVSSKSADLEDGSFSEESDLSFKESK